jgi:succinate-semialdehyde dehydrogenase / glutarate-semialdehyde dehydrogenase
MDREYPDTLLFIAGEWRHAAAGRTIPVLDPASEEEIGRVSHAGREDLDAALEAAAKGFRVWSATSAYERAKVMRKAAALLRERLEMIARIMTMEQGKPVEQSRIETNAAADIIEWFAGEAPRTYGWVIPPRVPGVLSYATKEPVGPVAAFTPWNFPINQVVRKLSAALATGCSFIVKVPEDTPASPAELVRCFADAGVPAGVVNLVAGDPAEISTYLINHPVIRKITFTGSTAVGKQLAAMAGAQMKRATMELGGHAPAIVFDDADLDAAVSVLALNKYRNAGQVCIAPTRFLVQDRAYDAFVEKFVAASKAIRVGDGLDPASTMGPLIHARRLAAVEDFVQDAQAQGGKLATGGKRIGNKGFFFEPTVMTDVPLSARAMNEEPFGPLALINRFGDFEEAVAEANRLDYGLAAYAWTRSAKTAERVAARVATGMMGINQHGLALPEVPFGGVKDSGYGSEGGREAVEAYLNTKFTTFAGV